MKIGIMGAGAVGCFHGAMLARAGRDVVLVGRPTFVEAVAAHGLRLEALSFDETVTVTGATDASALAGCDLVLVCVKSADTEDAGRQMLPHLAADATILSLQNGVDNAERLSAVLGRAVVPAAIYVAVGMDGPNHVRHEGRGEIVMGPCPAQEAVAELFRGAGVPVTISEAVREILWSKLVVNCCYNALSAVADMPYAALVADPSVPPLMVDLRAECVAVAAALGITLTNPTDAEVLDLARLMPGQYSSTCQDLRRGKPSEIDHLNGVVIREGERLGIPTPANRAVHAMVKLLEARARA
jgi:2-dehydropantoate 2-reductase